MFKKKGVTLMKTTKLILTTKRRKYLIYDNKTKNRKP